MSKDKKSNQMWGGRFEAAPDKLMERINASIDFDKRLYLQDIQGSKAHAEMLAKQNIITAEDEQKIQEGLTQIQKEIENDSFEFSATLEDIHMNIEARLKELIGDAGGRLHTARSRNDQAVTDVRLWVRQAIESLITDIDSLINALTSRQDADIILPGFTHLQVAQPITLEMHLGAYIEMLYRDKSRFEHTLSHVNQNALGAAALSGTSFDIDRHYTAERLGFDGVMENTLDAVSSRDHLNAFLFACAQTGLHLSRLAEELILWATPQFGFVTLSDTWSTGSSIMPQKKNPDAAELVRGKSGRLIGNLNHLMIVMKGLPLAYNKDMQEDKEPVFDSYDTLEMCLKAMTGMIESMDVHADNMLSAAESGYATATEIADWCVRELNMPFRDAHHVTGTIVKMAENKGCTLSDLELSEMQKVEPRITDDIYNALSLKSAIQSRKKKS